MAAGKILYQSIHMEIEGKYGQIWRIKTDYEQNLYITSSKGYDSRGVYKISSFGKALAEVNKLIRDTDH